MAWKHVPWIVYFTCGLLLLLSFQANQVSGEFKFLIKPQKFYTVPFGANFKINCTTNDPNATTTLYRRSSRGRPWQQLLPKDGKLVKFEQVYTMLDIGLPDAGQYQCRAVNGSGNTIKWPDQKANVFVNPGFTPPVNVNPVHAVVLTAGQSYNITCSSVSRTTLQWFKKTEGGSESVVPSDKVHLEQNIKMNELKLILMFKNAQKSDTASYKCLMTYQGRQNFKRSSLVVYDHELPKILSSSKTPILVKHSNQARLDCSVFGHPRPTVSWYKDGKEITVQDCTVNDYNPTCKDSKYILMAKPVTKHTKLNSSLTILNSMYPDDQGKYTCKAVNSQGTRNTTFFVDIKAEFKFLIKPRMFYTVPFASNFKINCTTNDPNAATTLYRRSSRSRPWQKLLPKDGKLVKFGQVYTMLDVGLPDAGQYQCRAVNGRGDTIKWPDQKANVFVNPGFTPPVNVNPVHAVALTAGQSYNITCSSVSRTTLQWFKKPEGGSESVVPSDKVHLEPNIKMNELKLILMLKNAQKSDTASYKCLMTYQGRQNFKRTLFVVYDLELPRILSSSRTPLLVKYSNQIRLYCLVFGHPRPTVSWYKDGKEITVQDCTVNDYNPTCKDSKYILMAKPFTKHTKLNSSLTILNSMYPDDQGKYTCKAVNSQGTRNTTFFVDIKGLLPHLKGRTEKVLLVNEASRAVMSCSATGDPLPNITWYKGTTLIGCSNDGKPCGPNLQYTLRSLTKWKKNAKLVRSHLRISQSSRLRDQGNYTCVAKNIHGEARRFYGLTIN